MHGPGGGCWSQHHGVPEPVCAAAHAGDFRHITVDMYIIEEDGEKKLKVDFHSGKRKALASLRTVISHVQNLITGEYNCIAWHILTRSATI